MEGYAAEFVKAQPASPIALACDSVWSKLGGPPCTFEAGAFDLALIDLRMMNLRHMVYALGKQHIGSRKKLLEK